MDSTNNKTKQEEQFGFSSPAPASNAESGPIQGRIMHTAPTPRLVEKRARELAAIEGRGADQVTAADLIRAKHELTSAVHPTSPTDGSSVTAGTLGDPAAESTPKTAVKILPEDDQMTKELVEEGIDEAEHDQMVESRRRQG